MRAVKCAWVIPSGRTITPLHFCHTCVDYIIAWEKGLLKRNDSCDEIRKSLCRDSDESVFEVVVIVLVTDVKQKHAGWEARFVPGSVDRVLRECRANHSAA